ncbi:aspartyl protease family protein [Sphingomonas hengshuiensis]|uniref:PDZ domain-containing protein n=1 Tax=Sphingomonas hengshuiensis TaxID=1609977 RepID=A0A7U5BET8_9SPHN|nr:aspartyl protease family protein [Sphingomonas hengshuiensis]AJP70962.1 hypothetical protein TS85_02675 [Sphingomonas hengshuiensis]
MFALLFPVLAAAQSPATTRLAPDAEAQWVAFTLNRYNQIRFTLDIGGRPARAILDTGLSDSVVSSAFAAAAGLQPRRQVRAKAIGGDVAVTWADAPAIRFGGVTRSGGRVGILPPQSETRFEIDALIGSDILGCCALDIDFERRRFRILPSGRIPFAGTSVPLRRGTSGLYFATATLAGKRLSPVVVDTGDGASLTLATPAWVATGYRGSAVTTTIGWGIGGATVTDTAILPSLELGTLPPRESEVRIEPPRGFLDRIGVAARLGMGTLQRYRVLLDPAAGHMVLAPGPTATTSAIRSTSGLLLDFTGTALRIVHVMRGSPAAAAGLRDGDTICAADGVAVAEQVDAQGLVAWTAGAPGRTVRLSLCDGRERRVTLANFY